ncbi:hypothetical protein [Pseudaminobacter soli (ex Zhang et al. 2022)]|nr:hypothetical protein [Pseudaminobacter soli]
MPLFNAIAERRADAPFIFVNVVKAGSAALVFPMAWKALEAKAAR